VAVALAGLAALVILLLATLMRGSSGEHPGIAVGQPAPPIVGSTLDGAAFDLAGLKGRPVVVNFWGPSCIPCRDEFPLFKEKVTERAASDLAIVGVLMDDGPDAARAFIAKYGATWPTVEDPSGAFKAAYRVVARPQTYFIDRAGIVRAIQVGQVTDAAFERLYATISGTAVTGPGIP
jgi:cytochrome c biogenesis protein CcmG/thiol:disulfide interchange protein DsbE